MFEVFRHVQTFSALVLKFIQNLSHTKFKMSIILQPRREPPGLLPGHRRGLPQLPPHLPARLQRQRVPVVAQPHHSLHRHHGVVSVLHHTQYGLYGKELRKSGKDNIEILCYAVFVITLTSLTILL